MKILFIVKSKKMENLGVMYLAAVAKKNGAMAKICSLEESRTVAHEWLPDVLGFSCMTGDQDRMMKKNSVIKNMWPKGTPEPKTIFGGPHPTFFPKDFNNDPDIDMVVDGEAENWLNGFLGYGIGRMEYLDDIPWPDRTDFPDMLIRDFIATRGCPGKCSYCYNARWLEMYPSDKVIRYRSAKDVVDEVRFVNPPFAYFQDSCFGVSLKWLKEFCKKYESLVIPFHCHMRPNQVTEERVNLLANVNCASIRIALESASGRLRKLMRRSKLAKEETIQASRILKKYRPGCQPISLMVQNMLAVPTSTIEDDLETLEFNIRLRPDYAWCSIYSPYPGTELGDYCVEHFLFDGNYSRVTDSFFDRSLLNFKEEYIEQTYFLQKIFHLCVEVGYMPDPKELNAADFPMLIHKIVRKQGDRRLYRGII